MSLLLAVLVASLVGSPHCAGMCGAFACFYAAPSAGAGRASRLPHVAYNAGRLASYLLLGALAGAAGAGLDAAGRLAGVARAAAIASGTLMVVWGVARAATLLGARTSAVTGAPAALQAGVARALAALRGRPPVARALATGLLTTLLPCGWLYAFVATAAGTGSAAAGALVMAAFWLGTLPVMAAVGLGAQRLGGPLARRLPLASAVAIVAIGLLAIAGKMHAVVAWPHLSSSHAAPSAHAAHDAR
jgi:sulfite exporter TauE/SafE